MFVWPAKGYLSQLHHPTGQVAVGLDGITSVLTDEVQTTTNKTLTLRAVSEMLVYTGHRGE